MIVIRKDELTFLETPGANATVGIATPSRGSTEVSVIRQRQQPGGGNPPHSHDREEVMLVTSGRVEVQIESDSVMLDAGDTLVIPPGTSHQLTNASGSAAEWLLIAPSGIAFFHANGERADPLWAK
ncbi:MAG: cupin domain-containing protein [Thermomicrobiales bacterium]|nr:cupin domain-containing protein [Thermomicrobiales bacterium]